MLSRCREDQMVLPNVMCEGDGSVRITYSAVVSDLRGLLLQGVFPIYKNKDEMKYTNVAALRDFCA